MPDDLFKKAKVELGLTKEEVLRNVNQEPMPSRYLAGFSKFINENIKHQYMRKLVYNSFNEFVKEYVIRYENFENIKTGFIGSIAVRYKDILREVLADYHISLGMVEENPVNGLIEYHLSKDI